MVVYDKKHGSSKLLIILLVCKVIVIIIGCVLEKAAITLTEGHLHCWSFLVLANV